MDLLNDPHYQKDLALLEEEKDLMQEVGFPMPEAEYTRKLVLYQMQHTAWKLKKNHLISHHLAYLVAKWKLEKNTYYIDRAMMLCEALELPPCPALLKENAAAAGRRYKSGHNALVSTPKSVEREFIESDALSVMMNIIFHGFTLQQAASKTAQWMKDSLQIKPMKASTLDKYYIEKIRKEKTSFRGKSITVEDANLIRFNERMTAEAITRGKQLIEAMPEADEELTGSRRGY